MNDVTILYYTSNTENEEFERRIRANILKHCGDMPIISVSQKPIDFGKNICVGEHVNCYYNEFRQILIGLREVKTKFVLNCEADFLYPPEYFQFVPPTDETYHYNGVWVYYALKPTRLGRWFYHKGTAMTGAEINVTEKWLKTLETSFAGLPEWADKKINRLSRTLMNFADEKRLWTGNPIITFKTGEGINKYTNGSGRISKRLPYWGTMSDVHGLMFE